MTRAELLMKSAAKLREFADLIRDSNTRSDGTWHTDSLSEKAEHDEMIELAAGLLVLEGAAA